MSRLSKHRDIAFLIAAALVCAWSIQCGVNTNQGWLFSRDVVQMSRQLPVVDHTDVPPILGSIAEKHTFLQTFNWYRTTWQPHSHTSFWRPLTIQMFWLEAHVLGEDRYDRWIWLGIAVNCVCMALLFTLAASIAGRRDVALITVALYGIAVSTGPFHKVFQLPGDCWGATADWKNQEDLFADAFVLGSMIAAAKARYCPAMFLAALAVCCKESGWMVFPLDLVVVACRGQIRRIPRQVWAATIVLAMALLAVRMSIDQHVFVPYGNVSDPNWYIRYGAEVLGLMGAMLRTRLSACVLALAPWTFVLASRKANLYAGLAAAVAVIVVSGAVNAVCSRCSVLIGVVAMLDPATGQLAAACCCSIWLLLVLLAMRDRQMRAVAFFAVVCGLVSAVPFATASFVREHALHLAHGFQALFGASLAIAFWNQAITVIQSCVVRHRLWFGASGRQGITR